eukprot:6487776-Amphidinium_carterae.1
MFFNKKKTSKRKTSDQGFWPSTLHMSQAISALPSCAGVSPRQPLKLRVSSGKEVLQSLPCAQSP